MFEAEAQASGALMKAETLEENHLTIGADAPFMCSINRFKGLRALQ
jgi:hypothetical protein